MSKENVYFLLSIEQEILLTVRSAVREFYRDFREDRVGGIQRDWPRDLNLPDLTGYKYI